MMLAVTTVGAVLLAWAILLALLLAWLWVRGSRFPSEHDAWPDGDLHDRRTTGDRRRADNGPPVGLPERRAGFDRRASWVNATSLHATD
jgi:hypothetical protein